MILLRREVATEDIPGLMSTVKLLDAEAGASSVCLYDIAVGAEPLVKKRKKDPEPELSEMGAMFKEAMKTLKGKEPSSQRGTARPKVRVDDAGGSSQGDDSEVDIDLLVAEAPEVLHVGGDIDAYTANAEPPTDLSSDADAIWEAEAEAKPLSMADIMATEVHIPETEDDGAATAEVGGTATPEVGGTATPDGSSEADGVDGGCSGDNMAPSVGPGGGGDTGGEAHHSEPGAVKSEVQACLGKLESSFCNKQPLGCIRVILMRSTRSWASNFQGRPSGIWQDSLFIVTS